MHNKSQIYITVSGLIFF